MAKVSVIVPVYNSEKYINRSLFSLVNQTLKDIEIIVVNDGSTDKSKEKINSFIEKYPSRFKYYEKENGGLSSARNCGMRYATGEYIAFLDSDDYVETNMYELMYDLAKQENSDMVECDFIWELEDRDRYDKRRNYKSIKDIIKRPRVVAWNKLIKRKVIEECNIEFPDGLIYEDLEFFLKLLPHLNKISYIEDYFVHYVQRTDSISNTQGEKVEDIFKILNNVICYYKDIGLYDKYKKELKYMSRRICFGSSMKRVLKIKDRKLRRKLICETVYFLKSMESDRHTSEWDRHTSECACPTLKLVFGITKLDLGGAERVLVDMCNNLNEQYDISIFTIYSGGKLEKDLSQNIKLISLFRRQNKITPILLFLFRRIIYHKYIKDKFDVEIAFLEGPITRLFKYKSSAKKIAWVHNDITKVFGNGLKAKIKKFYDKGVYKKYDLIVFVSEDNQKAFNNLYGNDFNEKVIYNYIDKERILKAADEKINDSIFTKKNNEPIILTVARLTKQKAIDRLIKVHKRLIDDGIRHKVYVIGDGEEKTNLTNWIRTLKVENTFILLGAKTNPYPYFKKCDFFALLSFYEGYGIVLEEAKIFDKPIVITNTAAKEAVNNYKNASIADNNEEGIYLCLKKVLRGF